MRRSAACFPAAVYVHPHNYTAIITNCEVVDVIPSKLDNSLEASEFIDTLILAGYDFWEVAAPLYAQAKDRCHSLYKSLNALNYSKL